MKKTILIAATIIIAGTAFIAQRGISSSMRGVFDQWSRVEAAFASRLDLLSELGLVTDGFEGLGPAAADALRLKYEGAADMGEKAVVAGEIESFFARGIIAIENDAKIAANAAVKKLVFDVREADDDLTSARDAYNDRVREYNARTGSFPGSVIAPLFGYDTLMYFQTGDGI